MSDTPSDSQDNHLKSFIERIERLETEKSAIAEDLKEVFAEAKAVGYDTKIMRLVVKIRKMEAHERQEQEALLDIYLHKVGFDSTPLAKAAKNLADKGVTIEVSGKTIN